MEYDSQSWKDRCNRYFTSISDTEKDDGQEKDVQNNKDPSHDEYASLRDIVALQRSSQREHRVFRYMRKTLSGLDIHGSRFGSKSRSTVELVMWLIIVIAALAALVCILYIQIREYTYYSTDFVITSQSGHTSPLPIALSFCNKNLLRKSRIQGTRYANLLPLDTSSPIIEATVQTALPVSYKDANVMIGDNAKLANYLVEHNVNTTHLYRELNADVGVVESLRDSNSSLDYRISLLGNTDVLRRRLTMMQPSESLGHQRGDMIMDCWMDGRLCRQSEMSTTWSEQYGQCTTVTSGVSAEKVMVTLNAERAEYVHVTSPTVGFSVFLHEPGTPVGSGTILSVEPNQLADIVIAQAKTTERMDGSCNDMVAGQQKCLSVCFNNHVRNLCQCTPSLEDATRQCDPDVPEDYICIQTLDQLRKDRVLRCECSPNCRDTDYLTSVQKMTWPSTESMASVQRYLSTKGHTFTEPEIRTNIARVALSTRPGAAEVVQERKHMSLLQLLASLGGLSALIAGVSLVTVGELCWTLGRLVVDTARYFRKRSNRKAMPRRLSDSDITSVTWAMYRQRRREEEENKEQQNNLRRPGQQPIIGGNVQSRLSKRNTPLPTVPEQQLETGNTVPSDKNEKNNSLPNNYKRYEPGFYESKQHPVGTRNGYRRNTDRRAGSTPGDRPSYMATTDDYHSAGVGMIIPRYQSQDQLNDPRLARQTTNGTNPMYNNSRFYPRPPNPGEPVQLYGNTSAYFHSHVSEPMYL